MKIGEDDSGPARPLTQQSDWTWVNLTNFHALISCHLVAADGGESSHLPITPVASNTDHLSSGVNAFSNNSIFHYSFFQLDHHPITLSSIRAISNSIIIIIH